MSDPRIVDSDRDVWVHALSIASQNVTVDLTTTGVLDHIRHLIVTGQLVERVPTPIYEWAPGTHLIVETDGTIRKLERADWDDE